MTKGTKPKICPNERAVTKLLSDFDDFCKGLKDARKRRRSELYDCFVRAKWHHPRTRLTHYRHLRRFSPKPGRLHRALEKVRDHYVTKKLVDEAAAEPQNLKPLHDKKDLWRYARPSTGFSYGKHSSDKLYSAMWALAIVTANRMGHVWQCVSLKLRFESNDRSRPPVAVVVRWGRRKGVTTASSVEYSTDGLPKKVWRHIRDVWETRSKPFAILKGASIASCVNRWLRLKREHLVARQDLSNKAPTYTSGSPRVYGVNRDLDLLEEGTISRERYEVRCAHTAAVAERTYRRPRREPTEVGRKAPSRSKKDSRVRTGKKQKGKGRS